MSVKVIDNTEQAGVLKSGWCVPVGTVFKGSIQKGITGEVDEPKAALFMRVGNYIVPIDGTIPYIWSPAVVIADYQPVEIEIVLVRKQKA